MTYEDTKKQFQYSQFLILNILGCDSISLIETKLGILKSGTKLGKGSTPFPRILSE